MKTFLIHLDLPDLPPLPDMSWASDFLMSDVNLPSMPPEQSKMLILMGALWFVIWAGNKILDEVHK
jgi:hypothetical protein